MALGVDPTLLRKRNIVTDSQKMVGVSRCGAPLLIQLRQVNFQASWRKLLLTHNHYVILHLVTRISQYIKLEVVRDMSLRALVDCGVSENIYATIR